MSIISKMRKQNAIYWPPALTDGFGRVSPGVLVELILGAANYRVRWEDVSEQFIDVAGTLHMSSALVYVPRLPDGSEVQVGGFLWLGDRVNLDSETDPRANENAFEVKKIELLPNLKNSESLRTAYLTPPRIGGGSL